MGSSSARRGDNREELPSARGAGEIRSHAAGGQRAAAGPLAALQRQVGNHAVARAVTVQRTKGASTPRVIAGPIRSLAFGSEAERKQPPNPVTVPSVGPNRDITARNRVICRSTDGNLLRGLQWKGRTKEGPVPGQLSMRGKVILFFSGSHGSAETYSQDIATGYCPKGADVVAFNYRGFGTSQSTKPIGTRKRRKAETPSERGLYEDGWSMWKWVVDHYQGQVAPRDIILHGYSLGGAVASWVAKEIHERGMTVGGLVLHSSIANVKRAAYQAEAGAGKPVFWLGGDLGHKTIGKLSTRENLRALSAAGGKDLPIHVMSGRGAQNDKLGDDITGLHDYLLNDPSTGFRNVSQSVSDGDHEARDQHMWAARPHLVGLVGRKPGPPGLPPHPNVPLPPAPVQDADDDRH